MEANELRKVITEHLKWLHNDGGSRANLSRANLSRANLRGADLRGADLRGVDLSEANLSRANLRGADLRGVDLSEANLSRANLSVADLSRANLSRANLSVADLRGASLSRADLSEADLRGADLKGADLSLADLSEANLPHYQIPQEGELIVWKKLGDQSLCKLRIPPEAKRTASLAGRKCRAEFAEVIEGSGEEGCYRSGVRYRTGDIVHPDKYDDDPRIECTHGIHFYLTRKEAKQS